MKSFHIWSKTSEILKFWWNRKDKNCFKLEKNLSTDDAFQTVFLFNMPLFLNCFLRTPCTFDKSEKHDTPLKAIKSDYFYTIKKECFNDVNTDDNGAYLNSRSNKRVYAVELLNDGELQNVKIVRQSNDGTCFYKSRNGHNYEVVNVGAEEVITTERYYRESKSIKGLKRMIVRIRHNCSNSNMPYVGVIYSNNLLDPDGVEILPHGNGKNADASLHTRTSQKTLERERSLLTEG